MSAANETFLWYAHGADPARQQFAHSCCGQDLYADLQITALHNQLLLLHLRWSADGIDGAAFAVSAASVCILWYLHGADPRRQHFEHACWEHFWCALTATLAPHKATLHVGRVGAAAPVAATTTTAAAAAAAVAGLWYQHTVALPRQQGAHDRVAQDFIAVLHTTPNVH